VNGTHQALVSVGDINLSGENINIRNKNSNESRHMAPPFYGYHFNSCWVPAYLGTWMHLGSLVQKLQGSAE